MKLNKMKTVWKQIENKNTMKKIKNWKTQAKIRNENKQKVKLKKKYVSSRPPYISVTWNSKEPLEDAHF